MRKQDKVRIQRSLFQVGAVITGGGLNRKAWEQKMRNEGFIVGRKANGAVPLYRNVRI